MNPYLRVALWILAIVIYLALAPITIPLTLAILLVYGIIWLIEKTEPTKRRSA